MSLFLILHDFKCTSFYLCLYKHTLYNAPKHSMTPNRDPMKAMPSVFYH